MSSRRRYLRVDSGDRFEVSGPRGIFHRRKERKAVKKEKRRAAEAARPRIPGKETLREDRKVDAVSAQNRRSNRRRVRRALELVVEAGRRVAYADELARSAVLHADPALVVEARGERRAREAGAA